MPLDAGGAVWPGVWGVELKELSGTIARPPSRLHGLPKSVSEFPFSKERIRLVHQQAPG